MLILTDILVGFTNISFATHCASTGPMPDPFQPCRKCNLRKWVFTAFLLQMLIFLIILAVTYLLLDSNYILRISFSFRWCFVIIEDILLYYFSAIHQDEDDGLDDNQVRSPFGSSFRTFDGTDYSSIGNHSIYVCFYARQHICYSAYMPHQFRLSVHLSVRLSHVCIVSKRQNISSKFFHCLIGPSF